MTSEADRELLKLAAKAAKVPLFFDAYTGEPSIEVGGMRKHWNPLDDDGDAFRLLAATPSLWSLSLKFGAPNVEFSVAWGLGKGILTRELAGAVQSTECAMRRAIVRAAAEMGKSL